MAVKNLFVSLMCIAVFCFTLSVSIIIAQIGSEEKTPPLDSSFQTSIAGTWRLNRAESDDVSNKIGELLKDRNHAPIKQRSSAKQFEQPAFSISLFAPDAMILANGDAGDLTINEIFKSVIRTRTVSVDGILREYEIVPGANLAVSATRETERLTVETVSSRGNKMTETFQVEQNGSKLIIYLRVERIRTLEVLNLRRVYEREPTNNYFAAGGN